MLVLKYAAVIILTIATIKEIITKDNYDRIIYALVPTVVMWLVVLGVE